MSQGMHQAQCPAYYSRDLGLWSVVGRLVVGWWSIGGRLAVGQRSADGAHSQLAVRAELGNQLLSRHIMEHIRSCKHAHWKQVAQTQHFFYVLAAFAR